jgi:hypothetical protein
MWNTIIVKTATGSQYTVVRDMKHCYLLANHRTTIISTNINNARWKIAEPKLPIVGESWHIFSAYYDEYDHPERMPGGGKFTSPVQTVEIIYDVV